MNKLTITASLQTERNSMNFSLFIVSFSPDMSYAAAGSQDGSLCIWDTKKYTLEKVLKGHE